MLHSYQPQCGNYPKISIKTQAHTSDHPNTHPNIQQLNYPSREKKSPISFKNNLELSLKHSSFQTLNPSHLRSKSKSHHSPKRLHSSTFNQGNGMLKNVWII